MELIEKLFNHSFPKAEKTRVSNLTVGLGYTAVVTDDGGMGIAFTYFSEKRCCAFGGGYRDYEGNRAIELLAELKNPDPLHRSLGLAVVNALNYHDALTFPEAASDQSWMDAFQIGHDSHVAMVGLFRPLMGLFEKAGAKVEVVDDFQGLGDHTRFYEKLGEWAEVLVLTSTSILNATTEEILGHVAPGVKVIMLGPSTPMIADAFRHLPVHILAGTVPLDQEAVLKAVRHGAGTPVIHRFSRKACLNLL